MDMTIINTPRKLTEDEIRLQIQAANDTWFKTVTSTSSKDINCNTGNLYTPNDVTKLFVVMVFYGEQFLLLLEIVLKKIKTISNILLIFQV